MKKKSFIVAGLFLAAGCTRTEPAIGNRALGITAFEVTESKTELRIVGLDANKAPLAEAHLVLAHVSFPEEGLDGEGRRLSVRVNDHQIEHQSVGYETLHLPFIHGVDGAQLNTFLTDAHVAPVLKSWGIEFQSASRDAPRPAAGEANYDTCTHDWPVPVSCCEYASGTMENGCSSSTFYNRACTTSCYSGCGGSQYQTGCGYAGQFGCAPCWSDTYHVNCSPGTGDCSNSGYDFVDCGGYQCPIGDVCCSGSCCF
jgi:hypothetical protein